jgi:hypothetical protein
MAQKSNPAAEAVAAREAVKEQQNAEYYEREAAMKPTPTQAENDLAKVGALDIDSKEDDGSEWDEDQQRRVAEGKLLGGAYDTRVLEAGDSSEGGSRRGRKKAE